MRQDLALTTFARGSLWFGFILTAWLAPLAAGAEVTLDGSVGPSGALAGPDYAITAGLGRQVGGNLFHSFGDFNIRLGESAIFSGPNSVSNIIARVTGGHESSIDGLLRSTIPGADLFLLNPAGVMFGPHASLDLQGSFHVSTADYLRLGAQGRFEALHPENSELTADPPTAFGFLGAVPAGITFSGNGSAAGEPNGIKISEGKAISVIGGDIEINAETLSAPAGRINLIGVNSAGEVSLAGNNLAGFTDLGKITIADSSILDVSGVGGGDVFIRANQLTLDSSSIFDFTYGALAGGVIDIGLGGTLIAQNNGTIFTGTTNSGNAASVAVDVGSMLLAKGGSIQSKSIHDGRAGDINIQASAEVLLTGTGSGIYLTPTDHGDAGELNLSTHALRINDSATIWGMNSSPYASAKGADIQLHVADLDLTNGGTIYKTVYAGAGNGGNLTIEASDLFTISGLNSYIYGNTRPWTTGKQGDISINADRFVLADDGRINVSVGGQGNGGDLNISAREMTIGQGASITGDTFGSGAGGDMFVTVADSLRIFDGGSIYRDQAGTGKGGDTRVQADTGLVQIAGVDPSTSFASGLYNFIRSPGPAGRIQLSAAQVEMTDGGNISQVVSGNGKGDVLTLEALDSLSISGQMNGNRSGIVATNLGGGSVDAGTIDIRAPKITIKDHGQIFGDTSEGQGADINIQTSSLLVAGGKIDASTSGDGNGGNVTIHADTSVVLTGNDSTIMSITTAKATGDAGSVSIETPLLQVSNGADIMTSSVGPGRAGDISIRAAVAELSGKGEILASSDGTGRGGDIVVDVDRLSLLSGGNINSASYVTGDSGTITVTASDSIQISGISPTGPRFSSAMTTSVFGSGHGGAINLATPNLLLDDTGWIYTTTVGSGDAGSIQIDGGQMTLRGGSQVNTTSAGAGDAGDIHVNAGESVSISGYNLLADGKKFFSGLHAKAKASGDAGDIFVNTPLLTMSDQGQITAAVQEEIGSGGNGGSIALHVSRLGMDSGAKITAESSSVGTAGDITALASDSVTMKDSSISTSATSSDGGNIQAKAGRMLHLDHSAITTSVQGGAGNGGNIAIDSQYLILDNSRIVAQAVGGNGGQIHIKAETFIQDPLSEISASSALGIDGDVTVDSPNTDVAGAMSVLPAAFLSEVNLAGNYCASRTAENSSSLMLEGSDTPLPGEDDERLTQSRSLDAKHKNRSNTKKRDRL